MPVKKESELSPKNRDFFKRAKTGFDARNYDGAIGYLPMILKEEPLFLEGRRMLRAAQIQKCKAQGASFNRQMASMKASAAIAMKVGIAKKNPMEAFVAAEEALAIDPFNNKANEMIAEAALTLQVPEIAAFAYETIREGDPTNKEILHRLAKLYLEMKEPAKAQNVYTRIIEIDPSDSDAISGEKNASAAQASQSGGWDKAKDYKDVLKDKGQAGNLEQESKSVKSEEVIAQQIQALYEKSQKEPANVLHPKKIGELYAQANDLENAISWYHHAYEMGGSSDAAIEKIIGDLTLKQWDVCIQQAQEALETVRSRPDLAEQLPTYEQQLIDLEKQKSDYLLGAAKKRVERYPNDNQFHFELGEAYFNAGQYKEALQELQLGAKQPSVRQKALNLIGMCHWKRKMLDMAKKTFSSAASEIPGMDDVKKEIIYNLAKVCEEMKLKQEATDYYKQIYEFDMSYKDVSDKVEASYNEPTDESAPPA